MFRFHSRGYTIFRYKQHHASSDCAALSKQSYHLNRYKTWTWIYAHSRIISKVQSSIKCWSERKWRLLLIVERFPFFHECIKKIHVIRYECFFPLSPYGSVIMYSFKITRRIFSVFFSFIFGFRMKRTKLQYN